MNKGMNNPVGPSQRCDVYKVGIGGDPCDGVSECVEYAEDRVDST